MTLVNIPLTLASAIIVAALPLRAAAEPATATSTFISQCVVKHQEFKTSDALGDSTTFEGFVDVPDTDVAFTIGGTSKQNCVVVTFSAYTFAPDRPDLPGEFMTVVPFLDGVPMEPGEVVFSGDDDQDNDGSWARSQSYTWAVGHVLAGPHVVQMRFRTINGGPVFIHKRSTVVLYR
jgi:hypothetical protein